MSRAAMEARRAGTETGEVQEAQHGEGQIRGRKVNASRIGRRFAGHCGIGRVCGSDEKRGRARRRWRSDGGAEMAGQRKLVQVGVGSLAVQAFAQVAAALGDEKPWHR